MNIRFQGTFTNIPVSLDGQKGTLNPLDVAQIHIRAFERGVKVEDTDPKFLHGYLTGDPGGRLHRYSNGNARSMKYYGDRFPKIFGPLTATIIANGPDERLAVSGFLQGKGITGFTYTA